ncbi:glycosyltransferase family 4 protein [Amycolatopsis taiwanensis]|uniref:Glucosyltransferase n=1 Tax=Amycolatopsis taiwanensis TaxID=342230 RepID=A0A9W6VEP5_9PSEU|nr:glycosyltransferase family 4 protein [Amycolatopsis taiwanensis]GLY64029.1 glucosyltransferase [Amycolatopsis taiwanensis]
MRFAVVSGSFPPRPDGRARRAAALAGGYTTAGHEVLVLTAECSGAPAEECPGGYRVVRLPAVNAPGPCIGFTAVRASGRHRIFRALHEFRPDALHLHGQFFDLSVAAGSYARRHGVPLLLTIHPRPPNPGFLPSAVLRLLDAMLVKSVLSRTEPRYVVSDKAGRDYCVRRYLADERAVECFPAFDGGWFDFAPARNIRAEQALGDGPLIVSMGHVSRRRDLLPLVEALPAILAAYPQTRVLVAGKVYHDAFARRAEELGVRRAVAVQGVVPRQDVPAYFAAADIVAHDLNGGCGTASLEAMLSGTPTIISVPADNYPGVELRNGVNALLVPPDDSGAVAATVIGLLDDLARAKRIAWRQRELIRRDFTMAAVAAKHLRVLEKLVADNTVRRG